MHFCRFGHIIWHQRFHDNTPFRHQNIKVFQTPFPVGRKTPFPQTTLPWRLRCFDSTRAFGGQAGPNYNSWIRLIAVADLEGSRVGHGLSLGSQSQSHRLFVTGLMTVVTTVKTQTTEIPISNVLTHAYNRANCTTVLLGLVHKFTFLYQLS